jgi:hypothetical protein
MDAMWPNRQSSTQRPVLRRRASSSSELGVGLGVRHVSSSSELEPRSSEQLNFVYLESDFEESLATTTLHDEVSGMSSDSETSAEAQLAVETQRDRKAVQKQIESALHNWDARALQIKPPSRLKKSDLIRSAVESWASPQVAACLFAAHKRWSLTHHHPLA